MEYQGTRLEHAICNLVQIIKQYPDLAVTKIAVVGNLALWHYSNKPLTLENARLYHLFGLTRQSPVDTFLGGRTCYHFRKLEVPVSFRGATLFYRRPETQDIKIRIKAQWGMMRSQEPDQPIKDIRYGSVPYIARAELISYNLTASWRSDVSDSDKIVHSQDAATLISQEEDGREVRIGDPTYARYERDAYESLHERYERAIEELRSGLNGDSLVVRTDGPTYAEMEDALTRVGHSEEMERNSLSFSPGSASSNGRSSL
ncbi:hypothetical protein NPX13_g7086 [Xylaria arbuscula]|uniref:Uncharacterized protein n=1 Tax=Xylaria arbuscula TaxID=114810 RepID=A0A9W8NB57_9PEZI|nr:hypothetical protein NPX13_g7086 [Xylaria arbuscula]